MHGKFLRLVLNSVLIDHKKGGKCVAHDFPPSFMHRAACGIQLLCSMRPA